IALLFILPQTDYNGFLWPDSIPDSVQGCRGVIESGTVARGGRATQDQTEWPGSQPEVGSGGCSQRADSPCEPGPDTIGFKECSRGPHRSGSHDPRVLMMNGVPPCSRPTFPNRLGGSELPRCDRLRRGVHLLLTLYLLPAVLAVLVLAGLLIL